MHDTGNQNVPIVVTRDLFSNACENNPYKSKSGQNVIRDCSHIEEECCRNHYQLK